MAPAITPIRPALAIDSCGVIRVGGTRLSLDLILQGFHDGQTAEQIASDYPSVSLRDVYTAIAFYLENQAAVDEYLRKQEADADEVRRQHESTPEYKAWRESLLARARERGLRP